MTDLSSLGITTYTSESPCKYARALILGPSKTGKSTALATAPKPLFLNADGVSSLKGALGVHPGVVLGELPFRTRADVQKGMKQTKDAVKAGLVESVIFDSLTVFAWRLLEELEHGSAKLEGFDLWREYRRYLEKTVLDLCELNAHVFLVGHITPGEETAVGELPGISGSAKTRIPAVIDDWVGFTFDPKTGNRQFLLGPQKDWSYGARSVTESVKVPATVPDLLKAMKLGGAA
jgi:hypothetical protein